MSLLSTESAGPWGVWPREWQFTLGRTDMSGSLHYSQVLFLRSHEDYCMAGLQLCCATTLCIAGCIHAKEDCICMCMFIKTALSKWSAFGLLCVQANRLGHFWMSTPERDGLSRAYQLCAHVPDNALAK